METEFPFAESTISGVGRDFALFGRQVRAGTNLEGVLFFSPASGGMMIV
jgi:hypothetical protein